MTILEKDAFPSILPIVPSHHEAGHMAFTHAVLSGALPGNVFVDGRNSAIVVPDADFWFAIGEPSRALAIELRDWATLNRKQGGRWPIWASNDAWGETLAPLAHSHQSRHEYHFAGPAAAPPVGPGIEVRPLDVDLLGQFEGKVDPWIMTDVWGSAEGLLEKSYGWAALKDGEFSGFCAACAIGGPEGEVEAEIEIGIAASARRNGLATACGDAFIRDSLERGLLPAWTCDAANVASQAAAARLGFVQFRTIKGYVLT